ncbi:hypothetical protein FVE85_9096 [Porphyridium purpureum]|uniref:Uncharacterized protein n=1 Tax=Porphyridium purpureum TaxID=35688 RepID=A0A5J4YQ65_PORPP|nr:hypothetical protein FVE85_9096 [Porphyridium purpureum]|eukprot:POR8930..scf222_8
MMRVSSTLASAHALARRLRRSAKDGRPPPWAKNVLSRKIDVSTSGVQTRLLHTSRTRKQSDAEAAEAAEQERSFDASSSSEHGGQRSWTSLNMYLTEQTAAKQLRGTYEKLLDASMTVADMRDRDAEWERKLMEALHADLDASLLHVRKQEARLLEVDEKLNASPSISSLTKRRCPSVGVMVDGTPESIALVHLLHRTAQSRSDVEVHAIVPRIRIYEDVVEEVAGPDDGAPGTSGVSEGLLCKLKYLYGQAEMDRDVEWTRRIAQQLRAKGISVTLSECDPLEWDFFLGDMTYEALRLQLLTLFVPFTVETLVARSWGQCRKGYLRSNKFLEAFQRRLCASEIFDPCTACLPQNLFQYVYPLRETKRLQCERYCRENGLDMHCPHPGPLGQTSSLVCMLTAKPEMVPMLKSALQAMHSIANDIENLEHETLRRSVIAWNNNGTVVLDAMQLRPATGLPRWIVIGALGRLANVCGEPLAGGLITSLAALYDETIDLEAPLEGTTKFSPKRKILIEGVFKAFGSQSMEFLVAVKNHKMGILLENWLERRWMFRGYLHRTRSNYAMMESQTWERKKPDQHFREDDRNFDLIIASPTVPMKPALVRENELFEYNQAIMFVSGVDAKSRPKDCLSFSFRDILLSRIATAAIEDAARKEAGYHIMFGLQRQGIHVSDVQQVALNGSKNAERYDEYKSIWGSNAESSSGSAAGALQRAVVPKFFLLHAAVPATFNEFYEKLRGNIFRAHWPGGLKRNVFALREVLVDQPGLSLPVMDEQTRRLLENAMMGSFGKTTMPLKLLEGSPQRHTSKLLPLRSIPYLNRSSWLSDGKPYALTMLSLPPYHRLIPSGIMPVVAHVSRRNAKNREYFRKPNRNKVEVYHLDKSEAR